MSEPDGMSRQVDRAPIRIRGGSEHEFVRARVVRRELGDAGAGEVREPGIGKLDRGVEGRDRGHHLFDRVLVLPRREVVPHHERELRLRDRHPVRTERHLAWTAVHATREKSPGDGSVDVDVALAGDARGRDLPAENRFAASLGERALRRVSLDERARTARVRQRLDDVAAHPRAVDDPARFRGPARFGRHARILGISTPSAPSGAALPGSGSGSGCSVNTYSSTGRPPIRCSWMMRSSTVGVQEWYQVPSG